MALPIYFEGPSGGIGGSPVDLQHPEWQPAALHPEKGHGGITVYDLISGEDCRIGEIVVHAGDYVDSVAVSYLNGGDHPLAIYKMGGSGGETGTIRLKKGEHVSAVRGSFTGALKHLEIETSAQISYSFGFPAGAGFQYIAPPGYEIIGFWGSSGDLVDRLGVAVRALPVAKPVKKKAVKKKAEKEKPAASKETKKSKKSK